MEIELIARFDGDSKRYHRFAILEAEGISGSIYIPKGMEIPDQVVIKLRTEAEMKRQAVGK
jgi:hypothetical protein